MKRAVAACLSCLLAASPALAAPVVTGVAGPGTHGSSLSISGSGFGVKAAAAPLIWENLDGAQVDPYWTYTGDFTSLNADNNRTGNSVHNAHLDFNGSSKGKAYFTAGTAVHDTWFVQYWMMLSPDWDWGSTNFTGSNKFLSNIKMFRMWSPSAVAENFVMAYRGWEDRFAFNTENTADSSTFTFVLPNTRSRITRGVWHLFQFEYKENSAQFAADGEFRVWFDGGAPAGQRTDIVTRGVDNTLKRPFIVGWENEWNWFEHSAGGPSDPSADAPNDYYLDDMYVDDSWARVEVGDASSYDLCTHREIQVPTAWADGAVTVTVNGGSFGTGVQAYLFVTDPSGQRNASGFPVSVSGGGNGMGDVGSADDPAGLKPARKYLTPGTPVVFGENAVEVEVRDADGRLVARLEKAGGSISWDGKDSGGRPVESGLYVCRVKGNAGKVVSVPVVVVK